MSLVVTNLPTCGQHPILSSRIALECLGLSFQRSVGIARMVKPVG
jgi:hypothetical protein